MTGEQFLTLLEQQQMVPPHLIEKLRGQIFRSKWKVTAAAVAKLLVDANHLTAFQARQMIGGDGISPKSAADARDEVELDCAADDFQLTPLDDEEPESVNTSEISTDPAVPVSSMVSLELAPLESSLEDLLGESSEIEGNAPLASLGSGALLSNKMIAAMTVGMLTLMVLIYLLFRQSGGG